MVYVDELQYWPARGGQAFRIGSRHGHQWCHLWADSVDELIEFALALGMKSNWIQNGKLCAHFDLVPPRREMAIANGAVEMSLKDWYRNKQRAGSVEGLARRTTE